jgi:hypothetical protein
LNFHALAGIGIAIAWEKPIFDCDTDVKCDQAVLISRNKFPAGNNLVKRLIGYVCKQIRFCFAAYAHCASLLSLLGLFMAFNANTGVKISDNYETQIQALRMPPWPDEPCRT